MTTQAGQEEAVPRASTSLGRAWARISGSGIRHVLMTANAVDEVWPYALTLAGALSRRGVRTSLAVFTAGLPPSVRAEAWAVSGLQIFEGRFRPDSTEEARKVGDWLLSLARVLRPDVVHLNDAVHGALGWPVPAIVVAHRCPCVWGEPPEGHREEARRGLVGAARVVATSKAMLEALDRHHGPLPTGRVVHNARPPSPVRGLGKEPWVLASGSPGDEVANVEVLQIAARTLPIRVAGEALDPSGGEPGRAGLQLVGRLGPESMRVAMARAAVYAAPALIEAFGLVELDAALQGCALVLSDLPSLREMWEGAAIFVPPHDGEAWAAELRSLLEDGPRRRRLAEAARTRAGDFRPERQAEEMLRIYEGARSEVLRESAR